MIVIMKEEKDVVTEEWTDVGSISTLFKDSNCYSTVINGVKVGLFLIEGQVYALDDICTHGNAKLSEGEVYGFEIECPLHAGAFDVRNGKALCAPLTRNTRAHEVRQIEDRILVKVEPK
ncbi:MAG TPA: non-heme iron oxygenase ferredoxin subunit [Oligella sp.]|nr:non-heme iron oxygenase ferredoxin subunit [Oligella sp.]